jgi:Domain of unknown function (DUF3859)
MRMSVLRLSVSAVLLALPGAALAESPLTVTEVGIFCPYDRKGSIAAPDTVMGTVDLIDDHPVDVHATTVPAQLQLAFGARYRLNDGLPDQPATMIFTHPPMGPTKATRQSWESTLIADTDGLATYRFDLPDELVLGLWTMQIEVDGQRVFYQEFTVVPPGAAPMAIDVCFGGLTS